MERALADRGTANRGPPTPPPLPADDRRRFDGRPGGAVANDGGRSASSRSSRSPAPPRTRSTRWPVSRRHHPARRRDARRQRAQVAPRNRRRMGGRQGPDRLVDGRGRRRADGRGACARRRRHACPSPAPAISTAVLRSPRSASSRRSDTPRPGASRGRSVAPGPPRCCGRCRPGRRAPRARRLDRRPPRARLPVPGAAAARSALRSWSPSICRRRSCRISPASSPRRRGARRWSPRTA